MLLPKLRIGDLEPMIVNKKQNRFRINYNLSAIMDVFASFQNRIDQMDSSGTENSFKDGPHSN